MEPQIDWTDGKIEELKKFIEEGRSSRVIASLFGCTRNAIIGKTHRLRLSVKRSSVAVRTPKPRSPVGPRIPVQQQMMASGSFGVQKPSPTPILPPDEKFQCTLVELDVISCRFPLGDPQTTEFRFCGAPKKSGSPYCTFHHRITHEGAPPINLFKMPKM